MPGGLHPTTFLTKLSPLILLRILNVPGFQTNAVTFSKPRHTTDICHDDKNMLSCVYGATTQHSPAHFCLRQGRAQCVVCAPVERMTVR